MKAYTKSIFSLFLLLTIFIFGFYGAQKVDSVSYCSNDINCILELISDTKNSDLCDVYSNKSTCYSKASLKFSRLSYCEKTNNYDNCIFNFALYNNDSSYCEQSINGSFCYYSYAINTGQLDLCYESGVYTELCLQKLINP